MTAIVILIWTFSACGPADGHKNASEVKEYVVGQLDSDTSSYIVASRRLIDSLPLRSEEDVRRLYGAVNKVTFDMHSAGNDADAIAMLRHILSILNESGARTAADTRQMLNIYVRLGATFTDMGMPGIGLDYYIRGIEQCTDSSDNEFKAMLLNNIGILYAERNVLDKASDYFNRSLTINLSNNDHHGICLNYANLAELYALQGEISKAQEATQRSLDYIDQEKYPDRLAAMRIHQGEVYARLGQPDVAMLRFQSALSQFRTLSDIAGEINANLKISETFLATGQTDSASIYADRASTLCRFHGRDDDMAATLRTMAGINEAKGNFRLALSQMKQLNSLTDSLHNEESQLRLSSWEGLDREMNAPSGKDCGHALPLAAATIIAAAMLAVALVAIYREKSARRRERDAKDLAERLSAENLEKIDNLNRELTSLSLEKLKLSEGMTDLTENLRQLLLELNPRETAKRDHLRSMLARLNAMTTGTADEEFKLYFERIHPDFFATLNGRFPDLTPRDRRLCAFLYLGMTTKEIATLTYREVRSVESARNRLRKKLGLDLSDDLCAFLQSLQLR